jgi:predicted protein tyrosine phosphatase
MQVRVAPLALAADRAKDWATKVISLIQEELIPELPNFSPVKHLVLRMEDVENDISPDRPKQIHIDTAFDFVSTEDNVLVHCEGGISRSVALAIGLLVQDGKTIEEAVIEVHQWSPNMWPNKLMLDLIGAKIKIADFTSKVSKARAVFGTDIWLWCRECQAFFHDGDNCAGKHFLE